MPKAAGRHFATNHLNIPCCTGCRTCTSHWTERYFLSTLPFSNATSMHRNVRAHFVRFLVLSRAHFYAFALSLNFDKSFRSLTFTIGFSRLPRIHSYPHYVHVWMKRKYLWNYISAMKIYQFAQHAITQQLKINWFIRRIRKTSHDKMWEETNKNDTISRSTAFYIYVVPWAHPSSCKLIRHPD